jgi:hypothetical protein
MRRVLYLGGACLLGLLVGFVAWQRGATPFIRGAATYAFSNPENGGIANKSYTNKYFGLSYRPPQGWTEGDSGPGASVSGYYVLATLIPASELDAAILISAQDSFFGSSTQASLAATMHDFQQGISSIDGMTIDREVTEATIAGRAFYRVDYSGVGLFRAAIATEIRCHVVSFNLTARLPESLKHLIDSLDHLSLGRSGSDPSPPPCVKDYATGNNVLRKVAPVLAGPKFTRIPVRIIIGADGSVKHVHVIRASADQRRNIEEALYRWKLKPYEVGGRPSPIETGLVFKFTGDE